MEERSKKIRRSKEKHTREEDIPYIDILQTCNIYIYSNHNSEKNLEREKNLIEMDARASYGLL